MAHVVGMPLKAMIKVPFDLSTPCWPWQGQIKEPHGYGVKSVDGVMTTCQRYVWSMMFGPVPVGCVIGAACGDRTCANPQHLRCYESQAHALRAGTGASLSPGDVLEIRRQKKNKTPQTSKLLAEKYGVSPQAIRDIWVGRTWRRTVSRNPQQKDEAA